MTGRGKDERIGWISDDVLYITESERVKVRLQW